MSELRNRDGTVIDLAGEDNILVEAVVTGVAVLTGNTACRCERKDPTKWDVRPDGLAICRVCQQDAARITTDVYFHY